MGSITTKYCSKAITVEYEVEGSSSPTTYSPMNGADGGDCPVFSVVEAYSEQGNVLFTDRQREKWEEQIALEHVEEDFYDEPYD